MPDPTPDTKAARDAWVRYSADREKATFVTANLLICLLVPAWAGVDWMLEARLAPRFLLLRAADVILTLVLTRLIRRSSDTEKSRRMMSASVVLVALTIIAMLPQVSHYSLYTFGFSLVFWGCGLLLLWPLSHAVITFGAILLVHVAVYSAWSGNVPPRVFAGSLFYVVSAAIISSAQLVVRRRLEHGAFLASATLHERNEELASTVAALHATQARLAAASAVLAESLDADETGARVTQIAVPAFATWAALVGTGPGGAVVRAAAHVDPLRQKALEAALAEWDGTRPQASRATDCIIDATPEDLERIAGAAVSKAVTARSIVATPLVARGQRTGTLVLGRADRGYEPSDVAFAEEIAQRGALAMENARLFREAEEAVRVRDDFISIAGHELRTPLSPLSLIVEMLLRSYSPDDKMRANLVKLGRHVARMTALISQLLDVSQLTAGRLAIHREEMDLAELVREVVGRFEEDAVRARSPIEPSIASVARGSWDRTRLDQVASNLLSNAIKYGAGKPIAVSLALRGEHGVELRVADLGIGVSAEDQARIFERFERAVSSRHYGGLGLGLWITRRIIEAHGGTIRVESAQGKGSTFIVELPTS